MLWLLNCYLSDYKTIRFLRIIRFLRMNVRNSAMKAPKRSVFVGWLLATLLFVSVGVQAQIINFDVTVTLNYEEVEADGSSFFKTEIVPSGMRISTFGVEGSARLAATRYNKEYLNIRKGFLPGYGMNAELARYRADLSVGTIVKF